MGTHPDEIPVAELEITERLPDGTTLTTRGRGRVMPGDIWPQRSEIRWFADVDGRYFTRSITHEESPR